MMSGQCFNYMPFDSFMSNTRYEPLLGQKEFYGREGVSGYEYGAMYGQAGMSYTFDTQSKTEYWGAPGVWNWTGTFAM